MRTMAKVFDKAGVPLPECDSLPQQLDLPASVSPDNQALLKSLFPQHVAFCKTLTAASLMQKGLLPRAYGEWSDAKAALDEQMAESAKAALALKKESQAYEAKAQELVALKLTGENLKQGLISHAAALAKALNDAKKLKLGLEGDETVDALIELLTAAAGSEVTPLSPSVARAAIVAKEIPSLAADLADLEAGKRAPPVSGLLLALRHQSLLAQAAMLTSRKPRNGEAMPTPYATTRCFRPERSTPARTATSSASTWTASARWPTSRFKTACSHSPGRHACARRRRPTRSARSIRL
jgi:hypothetical protein